MASISSCSKEKSAFNLNVSWSAEELKILSEFVKEHKARELFGSSGKGTRAPANMKKIKKAQWQLAGQAPLENGGPKRDWQKVRKKWGELASKARKYRHDQCRTGRPLVLGLFLLVMSVRPKR